MIRKTNTEWQMQRRLQLEPVSSGFDLLNNSEYMDDIDTAPRKWLSVLPSPSPIAGNCVLQATKVWYALCEEYFGPTHEKFHSLVVAMQKASASKEEQIFNVMAVKAGVFAMLHSFQPEIWPADFYLKCLRAVEFLCHCYK
jgi:hypothetical protein